MDGDSTNLTTARETTVFQSPPKRGFASRLFGYDIFLSFALGAPPRGTLSYASDLARCLRERDFTVFFSEEEAPPGEQLDSTLRKALLRSKVLVVIANRGTLEEPRWVRKEVEEFRRNHPDRPVIPINVGGALQDPLLATGAQEWIGHEGKIWLDESEEAIAAGIATQKLVERLATAPAHARSNIWWRRVVGSVVFTLTILATIAVVAAWIAQNRLAQVNAGNSRRLVRESGVQADQGCSDLGVLLALAALRQGKPEGQLLSDAQDMLWYSLIRQPGLAYTLTGTKAVFSLKRDRIATSNGAVAHIWDATDGRLITPLTGPMGEVRAMAFHPDGTRIVTAADDGTIRIWNTTTGKQLSVIHENKAHVSYARFSPDGTKIFTFSWSHNGRAQVIRADTGELLARLDRVASPTAISLDGKFVVTAEEDGTAEIQNIETGQIVARLIGHRARVWRAAFSPDNQQVVTAAEDGTARVWRFNTGRQLYSLKGEDGSPEFSPNGKYVVTFSQDGGGTGRARVWDSKTGKELFGIPKTMGEVTFSPDSTRMATIHSEGCSNALPMKAHHDSTNGAELSTARLWDIPTGEAISVIRFMGRLQSAAFSADGHLFAIPSSDGKVRVWKPALGEAIRTVQEEGEIAFVFLSGDDRYIISGIRDFGPFGDDPIKVHVRDTVSDKPIATWPLGRIASVAMSENGARLITTTLLKQGQGNEVKGATPEDIYPPDHKAKVWDAMTGKQIASLKSGQRSIRTVALSPDGSIAVTTSEDGVARIWNVATEDLLHVLSVSGEPITTAAFFHNGTIVATGAENGTVREWDTAKGSLLKTHNGLRGHGTIVSLGVSQNRWHAVTSSKDGTIKVWAIDEGRELLRARQGTSSDKISLSTDGKRFATGFRDGAVDVWNVGTGSHILVLKPGIGYWDRALSAAFQADGTRPIRRAEDGAWIGTLAESGGYDEITSIAFSSDGERIVTGSKDGTIRLWHVPAFAGWEAIKEYSHKALPAGLTSDERERFGVAEDK